MKTRRFKFISDILSDQVIYDDTCEMMMKKYREAIKDDDIYSDIMRPLLWLKTENLSFRKDLEQAVRKCDKIANIYNNMKLVDDTYLEYSNKTTTIRLFKGNIGCFNMERLNKLEKVVMGAF